MHGRPWPHCVHDRDGGCITRAAGCASTSAGLDHNVLMPHIRSRRHCRPGETRTTGYRERSLTVDQGRRLRTLGGGLPRKITDRRPEGRRLRTAGGAVVTGRQLANAEGPEAVTTCGGDCGAPRTTVAADLTRRRRDGRRQRSSYEAERLACEMARAIGDPDRRTSPAATRL